MSQATRRSVPVPTLTLRPSARAVRHVLTLMLAASCIAEFDVHQAHAAEANEISNTRSYSISAGALSPALSSFAAKAGVSISAEASLLSGLTSKGLQGNYSLQEGFNRLLEGSGLEAVSQGSGNYTVRKLPANNAATLPTITATAANTAVSEGSGSYTSGSMSTATGLSLSQRQTPQSISIMSRQQMDDFGLTTLQDVAQATPGIYSKGQGVSEQEMTYYSRGFAMNHVNVDGLALDVTGFNERNVSADMIMYDRVEVVRGATGLMEGAGAPAGSINLIRKRPVASPLFNASASIGSWNSKQLTVDASRALNEAATLRGRVAASWSDSDSFVDVVNTKNGTLYGIVEADLTPDTTLGLGFSMQRTRNDGISIGLPTYADGRHMNLPRSTFLNEANSFINRDNDVLFADLETRLAGGWRSKFSISHINAESDSRYTNNNRILGQAFTFNKSETGWAYSTQQVIADMRVSGPIELFGRQHELLLGASYRNDDSDASQTWRSGGNQAFDINNWNPYSYISNGSPAAPYNWGRKTKEKGLYASGNFSLAEPLHLIAGARVGWYTQDVTGWYGTTPTWRRGLEENAKIIPYLGLVYDLDKQHSVYASWTQIFQPQSSMDVNGNTLDPMSGTNYEIGVKGEYFGGKLNTSAALFRIEQSNRAIRDEQNCPTSGAISCSRAAGEILSEGVELELSGALTPRWQISGGYTYVMATFTKDGNPNNIGKRVATDEPRHLFKLYTNYRLPGALEKWNVGASVYSQNRIYRNDATYNTEQGTYAIFGLTAGYKVSENLQLRLNIDNVFDRTYYSALGYTWSGGLERYGAPRSALLTLNYKM